MGGGILLLLQLLLLVLITSQVRSGYSSITTDFSRDDFPLGFVFGAGTSAYQYEGAVAEDGRTPSIWDTFTHQGGMPDKSTADVAADGYHKYKDDVKFMSETGLQVYRFSISWSRLLPNGRGAINPKGLKYYNSLIDELIKHGIQPHVTLYHFDLPQVLEDEYGGWISPRIVDDFTAYADVCFKEFGDRVFHWTTHNEPNIMGLAGYDFGVFPPNRCSPPFGHYNCSAGNSTVEPYIFMHHVLLAHATVAELYKTKYQVIQKGLIGINLYSYWCFPHTNSVADVKATKRARDFTIGWVLNPLVYGDYPKTMREIAGLRLPYFSKQESDLVKGSFDFVGINHYFTLYISESDRPVTDLRDYNTDMAVQVAVSRNDTPSGQYVPFTPPPIDPSGLEKALEYLKRNYRNPPIYIHENGYGAPQNGTIDDIKRIDAIKQFIGSALAAVRKGSDLRGYIVWSFLDVFEFLAGYKIRYGLYYVNFDDERLTRMPKMSANWYRDFLKNAKDLNIHKVGQLGDLPVSY